MSLLLLLGGANFPASPTSTGVAGPDGSTIYIEFSPTTNPLDDPVWVDISTKVRFNPGVSIRRGRSYELDDFQTGTCTFELDNRDLRFDPDNASGPYYGGLKPMRQFRVLIRHESIVYPRFYGFIEGWPQRYHVSRREAFVPVVLHDAFWLFAQSGIAEGGFVVGTAVVGTDRVGGGVAGTQELSGARVDTVLDLDNWPETRRDLEAGVSLVPAQASVSQSDPLSYLKLIEESEDGFFFVAKDGDATFLSRHARYLLARMTTSQATFSDSGATSGYSDFGTDLDLDRVFNDIRFTRDGGTEQTVEDADSRTAYRRRRESKSGLLVTTDASTRNLALSFLHRYKDPQTRLPGVRIEPLNPASDLAHWLGRELLDRVTIQHEPMDAGTTRTFNALLEGYTETFTSKTYVVSANFSPFYDPTPFIVGDATKGVVGSRNVVH